MRFSLLAGLFVGSAVAQRRRRLRSADPSRRLLTRDVLQSPSSKVHRELAHQIRDLQSDDEVNVLIGYRNEHGRRLIVQQQRNNNAGYKEFSSISAVATTVPVVSISELMKDENIDFIEPDAIAYAASQATPFNIQALQGPGYSYTNNNQTQLSNNIASLSPSPTSGSCADPLSFKIAIIDSGVDISHYDLPCRSRPGNCIGQDFVHTVDGDTWNHPIHDHGTHVMGTIGALGLNNVGLAGMIPDGNVCFLIGKALNDQGIGFASDILSASEWAVDNGAHVINISIVLLSYLETTNRFFQNVYDKQNRLIVAAAGNSGSTDYMYPASYQSVISVASLDDDMMPSSFSQRNDMVDLAAFGRNIISTVPLDHVDSHSLAVLSVGAANATAGDTFAGMYAHGSATFDKPTGARLVMCTDRNDTEVCSGPGNHICLMTRNMNTSFEQQTRQCQEGGGIGAVIYHGSAESFGGRLIPDTGVRIPVISISHGTGISLIRQYVGATIVVESHDYGYGYKDGTSSAAAAVTGAIGSLWRGCGKCSNKQVEDCFKLTASAMNVANDAENEQYRGKLVQTRGALECLQTTFYCCQ